MFSTCRVDSWIANVFKGSWVTFGLVLERSLYTESVSTCNVHGFGQDHAHLCMANEEDDWTQLRGSHGVVALVRGY